MAKSSNYFLTGIGGLILIVGLILVVACSNPAAGGGSDSPASAPSGNVTVSIPIYAPWMENLTADGIFASPGVSASAFAVANRVVLTAYDSTSALVDTAESTPGSFGEESLSVSMTLPEGTGYTLTVEIYNTYESETVPTVSGTSAAFDITDGGTTSITVTCTPEVATTTSLTLGGDAASLSQVITLVDMSGENGDLTAGGETWFSFTAPANGTVMFTADIPDTLSFGIALFDSTGAVAVDFTTATFEGDGPLYFTGLTDGAVYYGVFILAADISATQLSQSFTLAAAQAYTISGTIAVPGYTDEALLPGSGGYASVFLADELTGYISTTEDIITYAILENPTLNVDTLEYTYTVAYDGDETAVLAAVIVQNVETFPEVGDLLGVSTHNEGTGFDLSALTGIDLYTFTGDAKQAKP